MVGYHTLGGPAAEAHRTLSTPAAQQWALVSLNAPSSHGGNTALCTKSQLCLPWPSTRVPHRALQTPPLLFCRESL